MSITFRALSSIGWKGGTNLPRMAILFVRSIILARLLAVEVFGIYAGAVALVTVSAVFFNFGLGGAFLYISNQGESEDNAAAVHYSLNLIFKSAWAILLIAFALIFREGMERTALLVLVAANFMLMMSMTPQLILAGRVVHRRLAILELTIDVLATIAAVALAWLGAGLWALLATDVIAGLLTVAAMYGFRPFWAPRFSLSRDLVKLFLDFGWRNMWADVMQVLLNKVDDLWTVTFLGNYAMGLYSRAYNFAIYPRRIVAAPVNSVSMGLYAKLAGNRLQLSRAFFRINALLLRAGFLLAGIVALVAPEFIHLIIGDKWLPFLETFRLMLLFTLLDPIKMTIGYLFVAVGKPEQVVRIRLIQFGIMVVGLFTMGFRWGIAGVAIAVDLMLLIGIILLLRGARKYVDFSLRKLFQAPLIAFLVAVAMVFGVLQMPFVTSSYWLSATFKIAVFVPTYMALLAFQERQDLKKMWRFVISRDEWKGVDDSR